jgi:hypothetical protein
LLRAHGRKKMLVLIEQPDAARNMTHHQVVFQVLEKLARHARICLVIEPGCGHSAQIIALPSKSSESDV